jgi:hypothetical protein
MATAAVRHPAEDSTSDPLVDEIRRVVERRASLSPGARRAVRETLSAFLAEDGGRSVHERTLRAAIIALS